MKVHETKVRCNYAKSKLYQHLPRYLNYIFRIPVNFGRDGHWMTQLYCLLYIHRPNKPQGALARHRAVKGLMKFSWSLFGNCPEEQGIWNLEPRLRSSKTRSPGNRVFLILYKNMISCTWSCPCLKQTDLSQLWVPRRLEKPHHVFCFLRGS